MIKTSAGSNPRPQPPIPTFADGDHLTSSCLGFDVLGTHALRRQRSHVRIVSDAPFSTTIFLIVFSRVGIKTGHYRLAGLIPLKLYDLDALYKKGCREPTPRGGIAAWSHSCGRESTKSEARSRKRVRHSETSNFDSCDGSVSLPMQEGRNIENPLFDRFAYSREAPVRIEALPSRIARIFRNRLCRSHFGGKGRRAERRIL